MKSESTRSGENSGSLLATPVQVKTATRIRQRTTATTTSTSLSTSELGDNVNSIREAPFVNMWSLCFGVAAFFDFSAAVADRLDAGDEEFHPPNLADPLSAEQEAFYDFILPDDNFFESFIPRNETIDGLMEWLRRKAFAFSIIFSLMWFLDAFIEAKRRRWEAFQEIDRRRLLGTRQEERGEIVQNWIGAPMMVYYRSVAVQLLFLPVGFYIFILTYTLWLQHPLVFEVSYGLDGEGNQNIEEISSHTGISLGLALLKYAVVAVARRTGYRFKQRVTLAVKFRIRHVLLFAVRHPIKFSRRFRLGLHLVRWLKYLAPLVGALNKLKGNCVDLFKKRKQHHEAGRAQQIRSKLWRELPPNELKEYAALLIQKIYRAHQARKSLRALRLLRAEGEALAALKLQKQFRRVLARARARLLGKQQELLRLKMKQKQERQRMKEKDRRKMYKLQQELNLETSNLLNKRLLLRPNTRFAVVWKIVFVSAVLFDIGQLALKPVLNKRHVDPDTGKPLKLSRILEETFVPIPALEQKACLNDRKKPRFFSLFRKGKKQKPKPWFCESSYAQAQGACRSCLLFSIHRFFDMISLICFVDVFVTFFTGELNENTGVLEPKHFFTRWILPGLVLQLAVNPNVEGFSNIVSHAVTGALRRGPVRVLRWTVSFFYPLFLFVGLRVSTIWQRYVGGQNSKPIRRPPMHLALKSKH